VGGKAGVAASVGATVDGVGVVAAAAVAAAGGVVAGAVVVVVVVAETVLVVLFGGPALAVVYPVSAGLGSASLLCRVAAWLAGFAALFQAATVADAALAGLGRRVS